MSDRFVTVPATTAPATVTAGTILPTTYTLLEIKAIQVATGWTSGTCGISYNLSTSMAKRVEAGEYGFIQGIYQAVQEQMRQG